jgi:hypothetical protein
LKDRRLNRPASAEGCEGKESTYIMANGDTKNVKIWKNSHNFFYRYAICI